MSVRTTAQPAVFHPYPNREYGIYNRYLCGVTGELIDPAECYMLVAKNNGHYNLCAPNELVGIDGLQTITRNEEAMNAMRAIYKIAQDGRIESQVWPRAMDGPSDCQGGQCSWTTPRIGAPPPMQPTPPMQMIEGSQQMQPTPPMLRIGAPPMLRIGAPHSHRSSQRMHPKQMLMIEAPPMQMIEAPPTRRRWPTVNPELYVPGPGGRWIR